MLLLLVANDVRLAVFVDCDRAALNPHAQDVGGALVIACFLADGVQLLLEVLDALSLLRDLHLVLAVDDVHELLRLVLLAHLRLPPPALATRLEDMDTTALGRCAQKHDVIL